jgi:hypothetical protein
MQIIWEQLMPAAVAAQEVMHRQVAQVVVVRVQVTPSLQVQVE